MNLRNSPQAACSPFIRATKRCKLETLCLCGQGHQSQAQIQTAILDKFWQIRGVNSEAHRQYLIDCSIPLQPDVAVLQWNENEALPGAGVFWQLKWSKDAEKQVQMVSQRLLELHALLGHRTDIDVGKMLVACPRLLQATMEGLTERLIMMKATPGADILDVAKIVEANPNLLLFEDVEEESVEAWSHGLSFSSSQDWHRCLSKLQEYYHKHSDSFVGFRPDDHPELRQIARMLRQDHKAGSLSHERLEALEVLDFEFDAEVAEWQVMYKELKSLQTSGGTDASLLAGDFGYVMNNWCCVQRISRRAGVLPPERKGMLDAINFDWSGADALS